MLTKTGGARVRSALWYKFNDDSGETNMHLHDAPVLSLATNDNSHNSFQGDFQLTPV